MKAKNTVPNGTIYRVDPIYRQYSTMYLFGKYGSKGMVMLRALIVEDNPTFRKAFLDALQNLFPKMDIEEAESSNEALKKMESFIPELVFMDIHLGADNGLELTSIIKKGYAQTAVIVLTDYNLPEYREAAFEKGADDFVVKGSLNPPAIKALIQSVAKEKGISVSTNLWNR